MAYKTNTGGWGTPSSRTCWQQLRPGSFLEHRWLTAYAADSANKPKKDQLMIILSWGVIDYTDYFFAI